ncbi:MAG TPA: 2-amino-4-hydroxy-6-hydroxymethyldihydropteridine diphosphokinase [Rhizomicrobium sp.]|nr:2-amino-4-hydroxy-6-hydroxymethyldihydropteridine diphosphokinase [Rhizomicrobium sp.]
MILIALGANLPSPAGTPVETLRAVLGQFPHHDISVGAISPFYLSRAWPDPRDPPFVNSVARIGTAHDPLRLLGIFQQMERIFGRESGPRNAPRPLDLDILDYEGRIEEGPPQLPHPRLHERGFVLVPLCDIAPGWRHPVLGRSVGELIAALPPEARALTSLS